jgi:hypothetical protein
MFYEIEIAHPLKLIKAPSVHVCWPGYGVLPVPKSGGGEGLRPSYRPSSSETHPRKIRHSSTADSTHPRPMRMR